MNQIPEKPRYGRSIVERALVFLIVAIVGIIAVSVIASVAAASPNGGGQIFNCLAFIVLILALLASGF